MELLQKCLQTSSSIYFKKLRLRCITKDTNNQPSAVKNKMKKNLDKITLTIMQNQNSKKKETIVILF
jgi:hypothetical protein